MKHDLATLKETLRIPELWQRLGLPGAPVRTCRSPFRPDKTPSFSIYDDGRHWKDFGTGETGDAIDFIARACHVELDEATRRFLTMAGVSPSQSPSTDADAFRGRVGSENASALTLPPLHAPTLEEIQAVAQSRGLSADAVAMAHSLHTLVFGTVCGEPCWILTDTARKIAEARRIDRQLFSAIGTLGERKAHTLRGSSKAWPVGAAVLQRLPQFRALMLVEGGPDYLAALHFCLTASVFDVLPIAMLGRSAGTRIDPAALELLQDRRIRIYPHADADGGGLTSAEIWADQLCEAGCQVDYLELDQMASPAGQPPIKDLNDAALAYPKPHPELTNLLP
jgi:hypothetical protein